MARFSSNVKKKTPSTYRNPYLHLCTLMFISIILANCSGGQSHSEIGSGVHEDPLQGTDAPTATNEPTHLEHPQVTENDQRDESGDLVHQEEGPPSSSSSGESTPETLALFSTSDRGGPRRPGGVACKAPRATPSLRYQIKLHGEIRASIASNEDSVVFATRNGRVVSIDPSSGDPHWKAATLAIRGSGPALGDDAVYVAEIGRTGRLIAFNLSDGSERWSTKVGPTASSPALTNHKLIVITTDELAGAAAYDTQSGERRWHTPIEGWIGSPAIVNDLMLLATEEGLSAFSTRDGSHQWTRETTSPPSPPATIGDRIVTAFESGRVTCFGLDGEPRWASEDLPPIPGLVALDAGQAYVVSGDQLIALDIETGRQNWSVPAQEGTSAVVAGDVVLAVNGPQSLRGYAAADGEHLWTIETERPIGALPLVAHDLLFLPLRVDMDGQADLLVYE